MKVLPKLATQEKLAVADREALEQEIERDEMQLKNPDQLAIGRNLAGAGRMKQSILRKREILQRDENLVATGRAKDKLWSRAKEIERILRQHMPSRSEMWRKTGTAASDEAIRKNMHFQKTYGPLLKELQDIRRRLEPQDPGAGSMEYLRPKK